MIAYYEMYLEMKFEIFSSVKSIVIIKIKISLRSQHLTDMINMYQEYQMQQKWAVGSRYECNFEHYGDIGWF